MQRSKGREKWPLIGPLLKSKVTYHRPSLAPKMTASLSPCFWASRYVHVLYDQDLDKSLSRATCWPSTRLYLRVRLASTSGLRFVGKASVAAHQPALQVAYSPKNRATNTVRQTRIPKSDPASACCTRCGVGHGCIACRLASDHVNQDDLHKT